MEEHKRIFNKRLMVSASSVCAAIVLGIGVYLFTSSKAGRPVPSPRTVSFDDGSGVTSGSRNSETITLTPEQARNAGIKTEEVGEGGYDGESGTLTGTGILQTNAYKDVRVISQIRGTVITFSFEPGTVLTKGQLLGTVASDDFIRAQTDYLTAKSEAENAKRNYDRALRIADINPASRAEYDASVKYAVESAASLEESKARMERARKLVDLGAISRESFDAERTRFNAGEAAFAEAQSRLERARRMLEVSPEAKGLTESSLTQLTKSNGSLSAARVRLTILGLTAGELAAIDKEGAPMTVLPLRAPSDGTLISRSIAPGEIFDAGRELFRVADTDELWFIAQVFEQDLESLQVGDRAEVSIGGASRSVKGRIGLIEPTVNDRTRAAQVRVVISGREPGARIGAYATLSRIFSGESMKKVILVKTVSIQRIGNDTVVFVAHPDGTSFEARAVRAGDPLEGMTPVFEGLTKGDKVVTDGAFLLRAEYLKRKVD